MGQQQQCRRSQRSPALTVQQLLLLSIALAAATPGWCQDLLIVEHTDGLLTITNPSPLQPASLADYGICRAAKSEGPWQPVVAPLGDGTLAPKQSITFAWGDAGSQPCPARSCVKVPGLYPFAGNEEVSHWRRRLDGAPSEAARSGWCQSTRLLGRAAPVATCTDHLGYSNTRRSGCFIGSH